MQLDNITEFQSTRICIIGSNMISQRIIAPPRFKISLIVTLYRRRGRPVFLDPCANFPQNNALVGLSSGNRTCPIQSTLFLISMFSISSAIARSKTSSFVIQSSHLIFRTDLRCCYWIVLSFLIWCLYKVQRAVSRKTR